MSSAMMSTAIDPMLLAVLAAYSVLLTAAIVLGGKLPSLVKMTHTRMQLVMSFVSGLMLGVAIFHLLPHAIYTINAPDAVEIVARWTMAGLLLMFMLLRVFHFHNHDVAEEGHQHSHIKSHSHGDHHSTAAPHQLSWLGIAIGLTLHTMIDGIALAASMRADWMLLEQHHGIGILVGLGVFLAILLHKPLDAMTISALMSSSGASAGKRRLVIVLFALICPLSALLVLWGLDLLASGSGIYVGSALAFSAGVFLCISLSDLLPEVHFHQHDRVKMTVVLLLGVGLALGLLRVEPAHRHEGLDLHGHDSHASAIKNAEEQKQPASHTHTTDQTKHQTKHHTTHH